MSRTIDYLFSLISPWAYLGFDRFHEIAKARGVTIRYRPATLIEVFNETGGLPLAKRHPVRQAYRLMEMQRWRAARGLPLVLKPKAFPFDASLPDRAAIAIMAAGRSPEAYLRAAHRALWGEDRHIGDEVEITTLLNGAGENADAILNAAKGEAVRGLYEANRDWALGAGVFGAPSYVLDGEVFWGQDRLDLLDQALASNRPPYLPGTDR